MKQGAKHGKLAAKNIGCLLPFPGVVSFVLRSKQVFQVILILIQIYETSVIFSIKSIQLCCICTEYYFNMKIYRSLLKYVLTVITYRQNGQRLLQAAM